MRSRFSRFYNIPELMSLFKEIADIKTADQLKLPVPEAEYETVVLKPSDFQKEMVARFGERAERVRNGAVDPKKDNMLAITNDGRKLALDQRLLNELLSGHAESKVAVCAEKSFAIWDRTKEERLTQLIFCDLSTPKGDGSFNVYEEVKGKLLEKGVPEQEIAFIHEANTETKKTELFRRVRSGEVRFLLGSTAKMGAGTNVQDRLIALHHLDVGWKPSDLEQREGRIIRQGNRNPKVHIFRYVTESTFDSYMWQILENKQKSISQIMTSKQPVRSCEDVDDAALSYAEVKALATGNPAIKEKMQLDVEVSKLRLLKADHESYQYRLEDNIAKHFPESIAKLTAKEEALTKDIACYENNRIRDSEQFTMEVGGSVYTERKEAGEAILKACGRVKQSEEKMPLGTYQGFSMRLFYDSWGNDFIVSLKHAAVTNVTLGKDASGLIIRLNHALAALPEKLEETKRELTRVTEQLESAKEEVGRPFPKEAELKEKEARLVELNLQLDLDRNKGKVPEAEQEREETKETASQPKFVFPKAETKAMLHPVKTEKNIEMKKEK